MGKAYMSVRAARGLLFKTRYHKVLAAQWKGVQVQKGPAAAPTTPAAFQSLLQLLQVFSTNLVPKRGGSERGRLLDALATLAAFLAKLKCGGGDDDGHRGVCTCRWVVPLAVALQSFEGDLSTPACAAIASILESSKGCSSSSVGTATQPTAAGEDNGASVCARNPVSDVEDAFARYAVPTGGTELWQRTRASPCPGKCGRKIKLFCNHCAVEAVPGGGSAAAAACDDATSELPLDPRDSIRMAVGAAFPAGLTVHAVLHPKVKRENSTCIHAKMLAPPGRVMLHKLHQDRLPAFDPATTLLLFPSLKSTTMDEIATLGGADTVDVSKLTALVVVESTWEAAEGVLRHPNLKQLHHVRLNLDREEHSNTATTATILDSERGAEDEGGAGKAEGEAPTPGGLYWRATPDSRGGGGGGAGAGAENVAKAVPLLSTIEAIRLALLEVTECQKHVGKLVHPVVGTRDPSGRSSDGCDGDGGSVGGGGSGVGGGDSGGGTTGKGASRALDGLLFYLKLEALRRAQSIQHRLPPA